MLLHRPIEGFFSNLVEENLLAVVPCHCTLTSAAEGTILDDELQCMTDWWGP